MATLTISGQFEVETPDDFDFFLIGFTDRRITFSDGVVQILWIGDFTFNPAVSRAPFGSATEVRVSEEGRQVWAAEGSFIDPVGIAGFGDLDGLERYVTLLDDSVRGSSNADVISAGTGADNVRAGGGDDLVRGGFGRDTLTGDGGDDSLLGGAGHDRLNGSSGDDTGEGGFGNDTILGGSGNDLLNGGEGTDSLNGGAGVDTLIGGMGDVLNGGKGADTADLSAFTEGLVVAFGGTSDVILRSIEAVIGGVGDDTITGDRGNNGFQGGRGDDQLLGAGGADLLLGGEGNDSLTGGDGADTLDGETGVNTLSGGAGNDVLRVDGTRSDNLTGGGGADRFEFKGLSQATITDYTPGVDTIDLSGIDATPRTPESDSAFTFIGSSEFTGFSGEVRYIGGELQWRADDVSNSGTIVLEDTGRITLSDFVF